MQFNELRLDKDVMMFKNDDEILRCIERASFFLYMRVSNVSSPTLFLHRG
jgi:hypothetical protein